MKKPTFILNNQCLRNNDAIEVKITLKNNMLLKVIALVVCLLCVLSAAACNLLLSYRMLPTVRQKITRKIQSKIKTV